MNPLDIDKVCDFVNNNIVKFHEHKIKSLDELKLNKLLRKNPYLFKAKYVSTAGDLISGLLDAFLSSSEEKLFGDFLEGLAIYISEMTCNGHKSTAQGVDLELFKDGIHYIISIKSGPNWGNSSQQSKLEQDLRNAVARIKQSNRNANVQPVLGVCYGKTKTAHLRGYMKVVGQNFWYLISDNEDLYTDIIEPIGYRAKEHNESFLIEKSRITNRFTREFINEFCLENGDIDWAKLVKFNSGNLDINN